MNEWVCAVWTDPDGVGECQRDGQRQSFWNSNNKDRNTDDEEPDELLQLVYVPMFLLDHVDLYWVPNDQDHYRQNGDQRAYSQPQTKRTGGFWYVRPKKVPPQKARECRTAVRYFFGLWAPLNYVLGIKKGREPMVGLTPHLVYQIMTDCHINVEWRSWTVGLKYKICSLMSEYLCESPQFYLTNNKVYYIIVTMMMMMMVVIAETSASMTSTTRGGMHHITYRRIRSEWRAWWVLPAERSVLCG